MEKKTSEERKETIYMNPHIDLHDILQKKTEKRNHQRQLPLMSNGRERTKE
jgi:hypothetical protein